MTQARNAQLIADFLGSAHVFAGAVNEIVEKRLLREVAGKQLTFAQLKLLKLVAHTDAHMIGDVAAFMGVSKAAASKAVDKLVRRNFLRRTEYQPDRRAMQVSLSEHGRRLLSTYEAAQRRKLAKLFRQFPATQLKRTAELLDRLSAGIVNHHARPEELCLKCGIYFRKRCLVRDLVQRRCYYQLQRDRNNGHAALTAEERRLHTLPAAPREKRVGGAA